MSESQHSDHEAQPDHDSALASLLDDMADGLFATDMTLSIDGLLISGIPMKESEYFSHVASVTKRGYEAAADAYTELLVRSEDQQRLISDCQRLIESMEHQYSELGAKAAATVKRRRNLRVAAVDSSPTPGSSSTPTNDDDAPLPRAFVFLKNVTIVGVSPEPIRIDVWRARLTAVTGWTFGRLGPTETD